MMQTTKDLALVQHGDGKNKMEISKVLDEMLGKVEKNYFETLINNHVDSVTQASCNSIGQQVGNAGHYAPKENNGIDTEIEERISIGTTNQQNKSELGSKHVDGYSSMSEKVPPAIGTEHAEVCEENNINTKTDGVGNISIHSKPDKVCFEINREEIEAVVLSKSSFNNSFFDGVDADLTTLKGNKGHSIPHVSKEVCSLAAICRKTLPNHIVKECALSSSTRSSDFGLGTRTDFREKVSGDFAVMKHDECCLEKTESQTSQCMDGFVKDIIVDLIDEVFKGVENNLQNETRQIGKYDSNQLGAGHHESPLDGCDVIQYPSLSFTERNIEVEQSDFRNQTNDSDHNDIPKRIGDNHMNNQFPHPNPDISNIPDIKAADMCSSPELFSSTRQEDASQVNSLHPEVPLVHSSYLPQSDMALHHHGTPNAACPSVHFASPLADFQTYSPLSSMSFSSEETLDAWEEVDMEGTESFYDNLEFMSRAGTPLPQWVSERRTEKLTVSEKGIASDLKNSEKSKGDIFLKVKYHNDIVPVSDKNDATVVTPESNIVQDDTESGFYGGSENHQSIRQSREQSTYHVSVILNEILSAANGKSVAIKNEKQSHEEYSDSVCELQKNTCRNDSLVKAEGKFCEHDESICHAVKEEEKQLVHQKLECEESNEKQIVMRENCGKLAKVQQKDYPCNWEKFNIEQVSKDDSRIAQMQSSMYSGVSDVKSIPHINETSEEESSKGNIIPESCMPESCLDLNDDTEKHLVKYNDYSLQQMATPSKDQRVPNYVSTPCKSPHTCPTPEISMYDELEPPLKKVKGSIENVAHGNSSALTGAPLPSPPPSKKCLFQADGAFSWKDPQKLDSHKPADLIEDDDSSLVSIVPLTVCKKPLRLGLSKKRKVPSLHPSCRK